MWQAYVAAPDGRGAALGAFGAWVPAEAALACAVAMVRAHRLIGAAGGGVGGGMGGGGVGGGDVGGIGGDSISGGGGPPFVSLPAPWHALCSEVFGAVLRPGEPRPSDCL